MPNIDRRNVVLLLLGVRPDGDIGDGIGGVTRLQKLLFLLENEYDIRPTEDGFEFTAYKAGPYSSKLYDDLEFLENMGLIEGEVAANATEAEAAEVEMLDFDELISDTPNVLAPRSYDGQLAADSFEERRFKITDEGAVKIEHLINSGKYQPVIDAIRKIKRKYGNHSLNDLLFYVYKKYPEMTTESEIKDKVLRRRH